MIPLSYGLTLVAVLCLATGQILFKVTADRISGRPLAEAVLDVSVLGPFAIALFVYGGATVVWIVALQYVPLARAYMFMALSFVIVPVAAAFMFREVLTPQFFLGVALIICGLIVTQTS